MGLLATNVLAQTYPSRPVTVIYPYPAGSTTEGAWRSVAQEASKTLGQSVIFENRVGAGGKIGVESMTRSPKDGHTVGVINSAVAIYLPLMDATFRIEPGKDYTPISAGFETYYVLLAHPSVPFRDVKGLIAYARANPGKLNMASSGNGTGGHLSVELLKMVVGIHAVHVPYKGEAPAMTDLLGGQVQAFFGAGNAKPFIESGKLIGLATSGPQRWAPFPSLPTFAEEGLADVSASTWLGLAGPAGIPDAAVAKLNQAVTVAMQAPEVRRKLDEFGLVVRGGTPQEFSALIRADLDRWGKVVRAGNIRLE